VCCCAEAAARRVAITGTLPESPAALSPGTPSALEVATTGSRRASSDNSVTQVHIPYHRLCYTVTACYLLLSYRAGNSLRAVIRTQTQEPKLCITKDDQGRYVCCVVSS